MAQTGFTPIQLYSSSTATNVPLAANLATGELAINITDGKLFYKDNSAAVQVIGWKVVPATAGGTGQTSYAVGDLLYANTTTTLAKLPDVATGNALISGGVGVAPSYGKIGLTTHVSGTLPTANGGTNLTSFTTNGVMYASSTSALATGTALTFDGNQLSVLRSSTSTALFDEAQIRAINTGTATINQRVDIAMRWQDGTYNGTGGIGMVRESATARSGTLTFYPINSSGDALAAMRLSSAGDATVTTGNVVIGTSGKGVTSGNFSLGLGANGSTSAVLIDTNSNLLVNFTSGTNHYIAKAVAEGSDILGVISTTTNLQTAYFMGVSSAGENAAASAIGVRKNSSTSRSINAAGTINASGADYAEYMTKAGDFTIAKGDVVGIDAQGTLTNVFADAISFVVKSTDPSYVGGDVWGNEKALGLTKPQLPIREIDKTEQRLISEATEDKKAVYETVIIKAGDSDEMWATKEAQYTADKIVFDAALETARQRVDRIAFAGQVPVNVTGATAGQYIIPINDNGAIKGEAVSNPTFEQYQIAVGKVIALEPDGRAKIIVKVA